MFSPAVKGGAVSTVIATSGLGRHRNKIVASQDVVDEEASCEERMKRRWAIHLVVEVTRSRTNLNQLDVVGSEGLPAATSCVTIHTDTVCVAFVCSVYTISPRTTTMTALKNMAAASLLQLMR